MKKVTEPALFQRMRGFYSKEEGEVLRKCRESNRSFYELGRYFTTDIKGGYIVRKDIDLEEEAREKGVLLQNETVSKEENYL